MEVCFKTQTLKTYEDLESSVKIKIITW